MKILSKVYRTIFHKEINGTFSYIINKRKEKIMTIIITKEHWDKLNLITQQWRLTFRIQVSGSIYPVIEIKLLNRGYKEYSLGNFLYDDQKRSWSASSFIGTPWDFRLSNLKDPNISKKSIRNPILQNALIIESSRLETSAICGTCKTLIVKENLKSKNTCKDCAYLKKLLTAARDRANDTIRKTHIIDYELDMEVLRKQKLCSLTKIPMIFREGNNLYGVSLDRINSEIGYTKENTRLICRGLNYLKGDLTDGKFKEFLSSYDPSKTLNIKITNTILKKITKKLSDLTTSKKFEKHGRCDLDVDFLLCLLQGTNGVCPITFVLFDLSFSKAYSVYNPSLDRIDPTKGYTKDNVQWISWGANRMKLSASNVDTKEFYKKVIESLRSQQLI